MAAGALALHSGHMQRERRIKVGWFHQHQIEAMNPADTPLDIIRRERPDDSETAHRSRLAGFGIGFDKQSTTVENLSGGERARLLLNMVAMAAPHLLILDEPTNHLDIDSRRALLDALNDYRGAVILITHDRSLIELVADRLWLTADGTISRSRATWTITPDLCWIVRRAAAHRASCAAPRQSESGRPRDVSQRPGCIASTGPARDAAPRRWAWGDDGRPAGHGPGTPTRSINGLREVDDAFRTFRRGAGAARRTGRRQCGRVQRLYRIPD